MLFVSVAWIWGGSFVAIEMGLESVPPFWFAGLRLLFGLAGVAVIAITGGGSVPLGGVALVFVGVSLFAVGSVGLRALEGGLPAAALQGWGMLVGALILVATAVLRGETFPTGIVSGDSAVPFLYLTLVAGVVGYLAYFELLSRVGPVRTNLVAYLEPVTAALVAWGVLGHAPTATTVGGFVLVCCGFALATGVDPFERVRAGLDAGVQENDLMDSGAVEHHPAD